MAVEGFSDSAANQLSGTQVPGGLSTPKNKAKRLSITLSPAQVETSETAEKTILLVGDSIETKGHHTLSDRSVTPKGVPGKKPLEQRSNAFSTGLLQVTPKTSRRRESMPAGSATGKRVTQQALNLVDKRMSQEYKAPGAPKLRRRQRDAGGSRHNLGLASEIQQKRQQAQLGVPPQIVVKGPEGEPKPTGASAPGGKRPIPVTPRPKRHAKGAKASEGASLKNQLHHTRLQNLQVGADPVQPAIPEAKSAPNEVPADDIEHEVEVTPNQEETVVQTEHFDAELSESQDSSSVDEELKSFANSDLVDSAGYQLDGGYTSAEDDFADFLEQDTVDPENSHVDGDELSVSAGSDDDTFDTFIESEDKSSINEELKSFANSESVDSAGYQLDGGYTSAEDDFADFLEQDTIDPENSDVDGDELSVSVESDNDTFDTPIGLGDEQSFITEEQLAALEGSGVSREEAHGIQDFVQANRQNLLQIAADAGGNIKLSRKEFEALPTSITLNTQGEIFVHARSLQAVSGRIHQTLFGEGQFKKVKAAVQFSTGNVVARAVTKKTGNAKADEQAAKTIQREGAFYKLLENHPNVVKAHGAVLLGYENRKGMMLDVYEGGVDELLAGDPEAINEDTVPSMMMQMADVMTYVHKRSYVHRDIKTDNFLFKKDETIPGGIKVFLGDPGLASSNIPNDKMQGPCGYQPYIRPDFLDSERHEAVFQELLGSKGMSDPQAVRAANRTIMERSDVYALGCTFYAMQHGGEFPPWSQAPAESLRSLEGRADQEEHGYTEPEDAGSLDHLVWEMLTFDTRECPDMANVAKRLKQHTASDPNATGSSRQGGSSGPAVAA